MPLAGLLMFVDNINALGLKDALKKTPIDDFYAKGQIRADGRFAHAMHLLQVKKPEESTRRWDYLKVIATIPGNEAYNTLAESACPLVKK